MVTTPRSIEDVHDPLELKRFTRWFYRRVALQAVLIGIGVIVVGYVVVRYPALATKYDYDRNTSRGTWDKNCCETCHRDPKHVDCLKVHESAFMKVPVVSVVEALHELVSAFRMDLSICATGSSCSYILTKTIDIFVTYSPLLLFTFIVCGTYVIYVIRTTAVQYEKLRRKRRILMLPAPVANAPQVRRHQHQFDVFGAADPLTVDDDGVEMQPVGQNRIVELLDNDSSSAGLFSGGAAATAAPYIHQRQRMALPMHNRSVV